MNGFTFKTAAIALAVFLSTQTLANNTIATIYGSKLGCMACHQGASMQPEKAIKKNRNSHEHSHSRPAAPTE